MEVWSPDCKGNIGAGISTLMFIFDGMGQSIFCRKMDRMGPMREEMDGKVFISRQRRHFNL